MKTAAPPHVLVIGSGMSGILMGYRLKQAGIQSFTILEKADSLGGTWRENTYPGVACDVPSHYYSYTFEPNPDWSRVNSGGAEIKDYFERTARKHGVFEHIRFGTEATRAEWRNGAWLVETRSGERLVADVLVSATGVLHHPAYPDIEGLQEFAGAMFHTARWDHSVDLAGKRVGIIGTGSTAAQIIPSIIDRVGRFSVFQRTPQWIYPWSSRPYSAWSRGLLRKFPFLTRWLYRWHALWMEEAFSKAVTGGGWRHRLLSWRCRRNLARVRDPELRRKLTPDYQPGCKRLIFSSNFYEAIQKPSAELVVEEIERIERGGVRTRDGRLHELDVLILSTGFKADQFIRPMELVGEGGATLSQLWAQGPRAYRSLAVPGMPNFFMFIGPHSPIGNLSLITIAERQADYIMKCIDTITTRRVAMAPRAGAVGALLDEMKRAAKQTVWSSGCSSWYLDRQGVPGIYPWTAGRFLRDMESDPVLDDYEITSLAPNRRPGPGEESAAGQRHVTTAEA
jgi:cation diffusion facilitator CzcD-associated flavoprotein CzcO